MLLWPPPMFHKLERNANAKSQYLLLVWNWLLALWSAKYLINSRSGTFWLLLEKYIDRDQEWVEKAVPHFLLTEGQKGKKKLKCQDHFIVILLGFNFFIDFTKEGYLTDKYFSLFWTYNLGVVTLNCTGLDSRVLQSAPLSRVTR